MWEIDSEGSKVTDFQDKESDAYSGTIALHFWSESEIAFTASQTITGLEPGTYEFGLYLQGGDAGSNAQNPVIPDITVGEDGTLTVGVSIQCAAKGWGTLDDFYLYKK